MPVTPAPTKPCRVVGKTGAPVPPINWMRGPKQYCLEDALNNVAPKINFQQLLDVSPGLRRELAELLHSSVPRTRGNGKGVTSTPSRDKDVPMALN